MDRARGAGGRSRCVPPTSPRRSTRSSAAPKPWTKRTARAAIAAAFPRASALLGLLLSLDTLALDTGRAGRREPAPRGSADARRAASRPAPRYAAFLEKYLTPIRARIVVADAAGVVWWTLEGERNLWTLRLRVRGGSLVPLEGDAQRRIPERLRATTDYATRMGRFSIAAKGLVAEVALTRTPLEKGFTARFRKKPDWDLPFLVESFLGGPLSYPFEGPGSEAGWAARETPLGHAPRPRLPRARGRELGAALARRDDEPRALRVPRGRRARGRPLQRRVPARGCATTCSSCCAGTRAAAALPAGAP